MKSRLTPRWSHLSGLGTSEKNLTALSGRRPQAEDAGRIRVQLVGLIIAQSAWMVYSNRLPLEFMDGSSYTTIIEFAEPFARRRGSAWDR